MRRRESLLALLTLALRPLAARAQSAARPYRVGWLSYNTPESSRPLEQAFKDGMRELGYIEGRNTVFEFRWAQGNPENATKLAHELVALKPDVILSGSILTTRPLLQATNTIPVVGTLVIDPVANGFAKSLAHPGGNFTGRASLGEDISAKLLEQLLAALPNVSRVGVLWNPTNAGHEAILKNLRAVAKRRGLAIVDHAAQTPAEIEHRLARMAQEQLRGFIALQDAYFIKQRAQIAELALSHRLASVHANRELAVAGGLLSYGANFPDEYRRAASYVDRILRGAKPGDLPIEQPMIFELVINLKTAKAIGIKIPQSLLLSANEVIE